MQGSHAEEGLLWGARVNAEWRHISRDCLTWANPRQFEKWDERGLVLWDREAKQTTWLSPTTTLRLLKQLRTTDGWRKHGLIVGEPATQLWLNEPGREPKRCLMDEMRLSPHRLQVVLKLLEGHEASLEKFSEEQEADRRRRIGQAYRIILEYGGRHGEKQQTDAEG
jgi:hypothetical protein